MGYNLLMSIKTHITTITSEQQFEADKPRYNAHQTGHGAHRNKKTYTRKRKHIGRGWE